MALSSEHTIPWDLIIPALQGSLNPEEEAQLQLWISSNPGNQELFNQLKKTWNEELNDYAIYREADENIAWDALRIKLEEQRNEGRENATVITGNFNRRRINLIRWTSVAAIFVLTVGAFFWYMTNRSGDIYQTGNNERQTVSLPDGSSILLYPETRIDIPKDYNKSNRVVTLKNGEAFFEVKHDERIPFIVEMGTANVKDIGTSFVIQKSKDSIKVSVTSGEVAFTNNLNNETRELSAGMSLKFQPGKRNSAPTILIDSAKITNHSLLYFENMPLSEVILKLQEVYNKKIVLLDVDIAQKRFKADLEGQSFETAIDILCKSLNIKYFAENGVYYLKKEQ